MSLKNFLSVKWLTVYAVLYMLFLYAPVILLPLFAFNDATVVAFPLNGFTSKWFDVLWTTEALHGAVKNSAIVAISSAAISTILGGLRRARLGAFQISGQAQHHGFRHVATGLARDHRGCVIAGHARPTGHVLVALDCRGWACFDLHPVFHSDPQFGLCKHGPLA